MNTFKWNKENTEKLATSYEKNQDLEIIANTFGISIPKVRGKLVSLGIYKKKAKPEGSSGKVSRETKQDLITKLGEALSLEETQLYQFNGVTKQVLVMLLDKVGGVK